MSITLMLTLINFSYHKNLIANELGMQQPLNQSDK